MTRVLWLLPSLCLALILCGRAEAADAPVPSEFDLRATLELPQGAGMARLNLPAQVLMRLQSGDAGDLRVFNGGGEPVAFAITRPAAVPAGAEARTRSYPALGLFPQAPGKAPVAGSVQVSIDEPAGRRTVWVQLDGAAAGSNTASITTPVQSAIFTTRDEKQLLGAIHIDAELPANTPVQVTAATSSNLAEWSPVALNGRLYRFDGPDAPANSTLEFAQPLRLEGRYLRLSWYGQEGVRLRALSGIVAQAAAAPARERAVLGAPVQTAKDTLDWSLAFATPLAALSLEAVGANTLLPVRILGRMDAAQPWRELARTVVYRLGAAGKESINPPVVLGSVSVRQLRIVAGNNMALSSANLQVSAEFEPLQLVFLATGPAPFTLAAGRANTAPAALAGATLASVLPGKLDDLPVARLTQVVQGPESTTWGALVDHMGGRSAVLWAVLLAGVLLLAGVAFALLRQLRAAPDGSGTRAP